MAYNPYTLDYGFGVSNQFDQAVYGPQGILGSGATPASGSVRPSTKPTVAEQAQIFDFALSSGLQIFSAIFGAITAINAAEGTATTQNGSEVAIENLGATDVVSNPGRGPATIIYQTDPSASEDDEEWYQNPSVLIGGVSVVLIGLLAVVAFRRG